MQNGKKILANKLQQDIKWLGMQRPFTFKKSISVNCYIERLRESLLIISGDIKSSYKISDLFWV